MCTLVVHHRRRADLPLLVAANRDESFDRPFQAPQWWAAPEGLLAPRDLRGGGSWIGLTRSGLLGAITNRGPGAPEASFRSRGLLFVDALSQATVAGSLAFLERHLEQVAYAGFHLLLADRHRAVVLRHDANERAVAPGSEDILDWSDSSRVLTSLHEPDQVEVPPDLLDSLTDDLETCLARHARYLADAGARLPGGVAVLKRGERRGTVSAAILGLPPGPEDEVLFRFAAGPPDRAPLEAVR